MVGFAGVMTIDTRAGAMVMSNEPDTEFMLAVMVTLPLDFAVKVPPLEIVASAELEEFQVTDDVRSLLELSV
jgi:hypothetical protein